MSDPRQVDPRQAEPTYDLPNANIEPTVARMKEIFGDLTSQTLKLQGENGLRVGDGLSSQKSSA